MLHNHIRFRRIIRAVFTPVPPFAVLPSAKFYDHPPFIPFMASWTLCPPKVIAYMALHIPMASSRDF